MKKYYIPIIVILAIIIIGFIFLFLIKKNNYDKEIEKAKNKATEIEKEITRLKEEKALTDKELEKLSKKEVVIVYKKVVKEKEEAVEIAENTLEDNKDLINKLEKCNSSLKRKDFMFVSGIAGVGFDQEWNLLGQFGGTINAKIYDAKLLPIKVYFGGGGTYNPRINLQEIIHGGTFIIQTTFLIGK